MRLIKTPKHSIPANSSVLSTDLKRDIDEILFFFHDIGLHLLLDENRSDFACGEMRKMVKRVRSCLIRIKRERIDPDYPQNPLESMDQMDVLTQIMSNPQSSIVLCPDESNKIAFLLLYFLRKTRNQTSKNETEQLKARLAALGLSLHTKMREISQLHDRISDLSTENDILRSRNSDFLLLLERSPKEGRSDPGSPLSEEDHRADLVGKDRFRGEKIVRKSVKSPDFDKENRSFPKEKSNRSTRILSSDGFPVMETGIFTREEEPKRP